MWDFIVWVISERECEDSSAYWSQSGFREKFREKPSHEVSHMQSTWMECKESWQLVFVSISSKAFPQNTHKIFCFAILAYLLHHVFTHTIYTYITHILEGVFFLEKTLDITLEN